MQTRNLARSFENGIVFYSRVFDNNALKVFYYENDTIKMEMVTDEYEITAEEKREDEEKRKLYIKQASFLSGILVGLAVALTHNLHWILAAIFFSLYTSYDFVGVCHVIKNARKKDEKGRSTAKFHSAEHKVINAYYKYGRVPTLEEIRAESCLSNHCGSLMIIRKIAYYVAISLITPVCGVNVFLYALLLIGLIIWIRTGGQRAGMLKFLEYFFLSKPTDTELNLALEGIKEYDKMEAKNSEEAKKMRECYLENFHGMVVRIVFGSEKLEFDIDKNES